MKMNITQEKGLRLAVQGLTVLVVLAAAIAAALYFKLGDLDAAATLARVESDKTNQAAAAARKKLQDELKATGVNLSELQQQQSTADRLKTLLAKVEPQIATALEAVASAKTSKPEARVAALTGLGLVGQIARGSNDEAALARLDRALVMDKANCVAALAVNLGGVKKIEVAPDCQALLPAAPAASESKPAAEAKPEPAPAGGAAKAAQPAAKG